MDDVDLEFEPDAVAEIARLAAERKTGARGLRTIIESVMLDIMYEIPSDPTIEKVVITKECVDKTGKPRLTYNTNRTKTAAKSAKKTVITDDKQNNVG